MKKVALLGDSIRAFGYGTKVPAMLGEEYSVFQPEENCKFAKYTLRGLFDWKDDLKGCDVIHWNNGLWDVADLFGDGQLFSSDEEYVSTMLRVADILKSYSSKIIFATTTPVRLGHEHNTNKDIERFNALIVPRLQEKGVIINDLYSIVRPHLNEYIREDDKIHLTDEGIEVCAKQVVAVIKSLCCN